MQEKMKLFLLLLAIIFTIYFFVKSVLIEGKLKRLIKAKNELKCRQINPGRIIKEGQKEKYSVFQNSIMISLDSEIVDSFEVLFGKLTDFAIEKRIEQYGINKEWTNDEISQEFEKKLEEEIKEKQQE